MKSPIRPWIEGIRAARRTPGWLEGDRLGELIHAPSGDAAAGPGDRSRVPSATETEGARAAARVALRVLARLRPERWRATCLYASVAECLALRALGVPARVALGARPATAGETGAPTATLTHRGSVGAHAWVVAPGDPAISPEGYVPFRAPRRGEAHGR